MYVPGYAAKMTINGQRYKFAHARVRTHVERLPTINSEGAGPILPVGAAFVATPGIETAINGNGRIELEVTDCSFDPGPAIAIVGGTAGGNPFAAPLNIGPGSYVTIQIYPVVAGGLAYNIPSFHINDTDHDIQVERLQPFTFSGVGNGNWRFPF